MNDKNFAELEIADLIEESVANAAQRRQQIDNSLVELTEEQAKNIEGGLSFVPHIPIKIEPPIVLGLKPFPIGIILKDPIYPKL